MITLALILNLKIAWAQLFTKIPKVDREIEGNLKKYKGWNVKTTDGNSNSLFYFAIAYITEMHNKKKFFDWVITYFWPWITPHLQNRLSWGYFFVKNISKSFLLFNHRADWLPRNAKCWNLWAFVRTKLMKYPQRKIFKWRYMLSRLILYYYIYKHQEDEYLGNLCINPSPG